MKKINVLIFPAGEMNSIELHDALSHQVNIEVFGCSSVDRHGEYVFKNYRSGLPNIVEPNFIDEFNKLIQEWKIDYVFPTHDTVALYFSKNQMAIGAKVIVASYETTKICRDKRLTYETFSDCAFLPEQYNGFDKLPVFIKPRTGQGGRGVKLINVVDDIPTDFVIDEYTISEYLPGEEMTVDCLTDANGELRACLPRTRDRVMAGICVAGKKRDLSEEVKSIAIEINTRLKFFGLWYFQLKKSADGRFKLLEISTRCAGTMCFSRARGVNLPLLSIYIAAGLDVTTFENSYNIKMDRAFIARYRIDYDYEKVYLDYDDTVINGNMVILSTIAFLYQCRNKGIEVILLTRHESYHEDTVEDSLRSHEIEQSLFSAIIKISGRAQKADYITGKSIFIDNSYDERKKVHEILNIPVFDVEGIAVLEDWRC